jgi:hypothetical protein
LAVVYARASQSVGRAPLRVGVCVVFMKNYFKRYMEKNLKNILLD